METPVLAALLNQETADHGPQTAVPPTRVQLRSAVRGLPSALCGVRFVFVTYAVEIEGDAPLFCFAEGVDD